MPSPTFQLITPEDTELIALIANWYFEEWKIPVATTIQKLSGHQAGEIPFQVIMKVDDVPIATGGLYHHVALLDRALKYKIYGPWLALVYTRPEYWNKGYGALLCREIESISKQLQQKEIFLFTHTAESFYKRLGWQVMERPQIQGKDIVIMKKEL
jgi:GNAT superfamily N-acetyltransferase